MEVFIKNAYGFFKKALAIIMLIGMTLSMIPVITFARDIEDLIAAGVNPALIDPDDYLDFYVEQPTGEVSEYGYAYTAVYDLEFQRVCSHL